MLLCVILLIPFFYYILFQALWNQTMLQSEDFMNASVAQATKSPHPQFSKL